MSIFGWSYPAGCSGPPDGPDPIENCLNPDCGTALGEDNDPDGYGVCSSECAWPAIGAVMASRENDRLADEAAAKFYAECEGDPPEWTMQ